MESERAEDEKGNPVKKKVNRMGFLLQESYPGIIQQKTSSEHWISAAVHKTQLDGFSKADRKEDMTRKRDFQGISSEQRNQECGLRKMLLTTEDSVPFYETVNKK